MCQCTSNPRLSDAGRPDDEDAEVFADPAPVGQRQDEVLVEPTGRAEVDVLDAGIVSEPGAPEPVGELSGVSLGELAVDEQPEAFLERQVLDLGPRRVARPSPWPCRCIGARGACPRWDESTCRCPLRSNSRSRGCCGARSERRVRSGSGGCSSRRWLRIDSMER